MAFSGDVRFHCTARAKRSCRKSKHSISDACRTVMRVLETNPEYGVPIPGHGSLRKMRVAAPKLKVGKSGGYRLIYRKSRVDEIEYVVFLEVYFKGDVSDLSDQAYRQLAAEAEAILSDPLGVSWEDLAD